MSNSILIVIVVTSLATYLSRFLGVISAERIRFKSMYNDNPLLKDTKILFLGFFLDHTNSLPFLNYNSLQYYNYNIIICKHRAGVARGTLIFFVQRNIFIFFLRHDHLFFFWFVFVSNKV